MSKEIKREYDSHEDYLVQEYIKREEAMTFKPEVIVEFKDEELNLPEGASLTNNKGGDKVKKPKSSKKISKRRKLTPKERKDCRNLIINKSYYLSKQIRGLDIWGIGPNAITLGTIEIATDTSGYPTGNGPIRQCRGKEYHNYFKKVGKKENSYSDGVELAYEIIDKYGKLGNWDD